MDRQMWADILEAEGILSINAHFDRPNSRFTVIFLFVYYQPDVKLSTCSRNGQGKETCLFREQTIWGAKAHF